MNKPLFSFSPPPRPHIEVEAAANGGVVIALDHEVFAKFRHGRGKGVYLPAEAAGQLGAALTLHSGRANGVRQPGAPLPIIGTPMGGGFFGAVAADDRWIIVANKESEAVLAWKTSRTGSPGARSLYDGMANTRAIADSDHPAATHCAEYRGGGFDDWHLGSPDDMTRLCRNLMPRAGGNPEQTAAADFKEGGPQAFEQECYWTSAEQSAAFAWLQDFSYGYQDYTGKNYSARVRAVRKILPFAL